MTMTIRELLRKNIDTDVSNNMIDDLAPAFVGPVYLLTEGEREFADILEFPVNVDEENSMSVIQIPDCADADKAWNKCDRFFSAIAGYVDDDIWHKWFAFADDPDELQDVFGKPVTETIPMDAEMEETISEYDDKISYFDDDGRAFTFRRTSESMAIYEYDDHLTVIMKEED